MNQAPQQPDLPRVSIIEGDDKSLTVSLDGKPQELPKDYPWSVTDPWQPARDLATLVDQSVFAELIDASGEKYTHVFDPDEPTNTPPSARAPAARVPAPDRAGPEPEPPFSISGDGFTPGEDVYIAVVVSTRKARPDGVARLPLPAALLNRVPGVLIMFGLDSTTLIVSDPTRPAIVAVPGESAA